MKIVMRRMSEETFRAYLHATEVEHARDRMTTDHETFEEARRVTRERHEALLPQGLSTPNQFFFTVEDEARAQEVGYVWFGYQPERRELFLYYILIKESERRRGYGECALDLVAEEARRLGCRAIWLNVMAHNTGALAFYRAQGYNVAAIHMCKHLEQP